MKTFKLSVIALTPILALLLTSCGKEVIDDPETPIPPKPEVKITYGAPEFSLLSTSAVDYENNHVTVNRLGEDFQLTLVANKTIYKDGIQTDLLKYSRVSDMKVATSAPANWITYEKIAVNDSTLQLKVKVPENRVGEGLSGSMTITTEEQKFKIDLEQDKALIEFSAPIFQNDYKLPELLFSRSGDTERKLRFRAITHKLINGTDTGEIASINGITWSYEIDRPDIFKIQNQGEEDGDIQYLKLKAVPNETGIQITGILKLKYTYEDIKGSMNIPLTSSEGFIIDIDDGHAPQFHE